MSEQTKASGSQPRHIWNLFANPIFVMGLRTRLRKKRAVAWAVITLTVTAFTFFVVYLTGKERGIGAAAAAKGAIIPILVIQSIILMLLGTGQVASGIAQERDDGTLNFQRTTPMSPLTKILGYLFGMPVRQYMMFAVTLPFLFAAVLLGGVSLWAVGHFYLVFFTTIWLYHMLGMVSGMLAPKARRASWLAQIAIVMLYISMPSLSNMVFTFFGFFTIIPTFQILLMGELAAHPAALKAMGKSAALTPWADLQFFNWSIHPTVYTLMVQGVLLLTCFVVVHRKWHREENHSLPKGYALGLYASVQVLVLGSLWPFLSSSDKMLRLTRRFGRMSPEIYNNILFYAFFFLAGCVGLWIIFVISPSWFTYIKGLRRAKKLKLARIPVWSDAASSFWYTMAFIAMTCLSYGLIFQLMLKGRVFSSPPTTGRMLLLPLMFAGFLLSMQALRERFEKRGFLFALFLLWVVPTFFAIIMMSAFREYIPATYVMVITPMASFVYGLQYLNLDILTQTLSKDYAGHVPILAWLGTSLHWAVALALLWMLQEKKARVRAEEKRRSERKTSERRAYGQAPREAEDAPTGEEEADES